MFEQELIEHCSPTLASIKAASLFTYTYKSLKELHVRVTYWNSKMKRKGITFDILSENVGVNKALIYVYRRADLEKILNRDEIRSFLLNHGYLIDDNEIVGGVNCENIILQLKKKFEKLNQFPHEIGIFLGYPIGDVKGFIENHGCNCKCTGYWKVYCNEEEATKTFRKYKKCRDIYMNLWISGRSVMQLTVAA
ncbi:MAG: DUF3793 family protein [Eubacterium sp.]|jgi:hypothetical protein|uniref:DUF3793 family protein n=1 Tax=Eubacterium album TaxID=2978477 RepID=A0ABT2M3N3_9FIRM|nr:MULTISPECIES: DUF3793 family protein [unclassified Eubacterium (in: firmicutes)]MCT7399768.1 DUF3793 family protein [Eubacterium sp. LFL-14]RGG61506.1 DUF3793 family protein [Eubacterium sp. AF17-7]